MRIYGPNGTTTSTGSGTVRRSGSSTFSLPTAPTPSESKPISAPRPAAGLDALLAMQGVEDATERRKRSVQRGRTALDALDDLKIGLLSGSLDAAMVARLRAAAAELKNSSGDPGLDAVLGEIELRVEVELAKAGQA
ncbi:class II flagellar assembly regulator [Rhodopseudomonas thermotolerans]|uniref:Class II flagellar assembly regulator n=2 Tax=Rhodopseudomonas TaxID=1073 RepID=A0A336JKC5_9BRAD|nr:MULTISPECIES: flagellar assembly protein FliX [Rhodopseudomonas]RED38135.1 class II flagellar assembly regulator [Rhodopseudomonas pentothenatexigens]REG05328.1 class II flagellar assembly regulator [Rhodopseudomonas thermotolerans]SSW90160.1 class II flagellar assembly regulator [Rhodopseudomonas pentothenatexigens]